MSDSLTEAEYLQGGAPGGFGDLPKELVQMVACHLSVVEILAARTVCRQWRKYIGANLKQFDPPLEVDLCKDPLDWLVKISSLEKIFPEVAHCVVYVGSRSSVEDVNDQIEFLGPTDKMTSLQLHYLGPDRPVIGRPLQQPLGCLTRLQTLRALHLHNGQWSEDTANQLQALIMLTQLEDLKITFDCDSSNQLPPVGSAIISAIAALTSLQHLVVQVYNDVPDSNLKVLTTLSRLQSLSLLDNWFSMHDTLGGKLGTLSAFTALRYLHLEISDGYAFAPYNPTDPATRQAGTMAVVEALAAPPALQELDLAINTVVVDLFPEMLEALARRLSHVLTGLQLQWPQPPTLLDLTARLAKLTALQRLEVTNLTCSGGHSPSLEELSKLSSLRKLTSFKMQSVGFVQAPMVNMEYGWSQSEEVAGRLCSAWGHSLTSLFFPDAQLGSLLTGLPKLRSLTISGPDPDIDEMPWFRPAAGGDTGGAYLPSTLTSLTLANPTVAPFPDSSVVRVIRHFCLVLAGTQDDAGELEGEEFASEACQAVAGVLAQATQQLVADCRSSLAPLLATLERVSAGSRGLWPASRHLLQSASLRHLSLEQCESSEEQLVALLLSCPRLRSLDLICMTGVSEAVTVAVGLLSELTSLKMTSPRENSSFTREEYPMAGTWHLQSLPFLRKLDMDVVTSQNGTLPFTVRAGLRHLKRLYCVSVSDLRYRVGDRSCRLGDVGTQQVVESLGNLTYADMHRPEAVSEDGSDEYIDSDADDEDDDNDSDDDN